MKARAIAAATLIMLAMGVLYAFGIFYPALEDELSVSRGALGGVSSLSLACFTVAVVVYDQLLRRMSLQLYAVLAFGLAAGGLGLFGATPSLATLLIGFGVMFAAGAGFGYGLALALAARAAPNGGGAISLVVAAFALSGAALALLLPLLRSEAPASHTVLVLSGLVTVIGLIAIALILSEPAFSRASRLSGSGLAAVLRTESFLLVSAAFFVICCVGLIAISHGVALLKWKAAPDLTAQLGPVALNLSYVFGSLLGGRLGAAIEPKRLLTAAQLALALALGGGLLLESSYAILGLLSLIGAVFGAAASFTPVIVGRFWGADRIGEIYGAMMAAYGVAGLLAPASAGFAYAQSGGYGTTLVAAAALCLAGAAASRCIRFA